MRLRIGPCALGFAVGGGLGGAVGGGLAVERLGHRRLRVRLGAQPEQPRQRLQVQAVGDADDVDDQAVVLARERPAARAPPLCAYLTCERVGVAMITQVIDGSS